LDKDIKNPKLNIDGLKVPEDRINCQIVGANSFFGELELIEVTPRISSAKCVSKTAFLY
jgi:hypothetical protein